MAIKDNTILLVDDEVHITNIIKSTLKDEIATILTAASGEEALEILKTQPVDLACLDLHMDGMSGLDLLEHINQNYPQTVCIILTAHSEKEEIRRAMQNGAFDYILKPFNFEVLMHVISRSLELSRYKKTQAEMLEILLYHYSSINPEIFQQKPLAEREKILKAVIGVLKSQALKKRLLQDDK